MGKSISFEHRIFEVDEQRMTICLNQACHTCLSRSVRHRVTVIGNLENDVGQQISLLEKSQ